MSFFRLFIFSVSFLAFIAMPVLAQTTGSVPQRIDPSEIEGQIQASAYVVIDRTTGKLLTVKQEEREWPIASLTKLMTAQVVLEQGVSLTSFQSIVSTDDVGGAKLYVNNGDRFIIDDLFYAMLSASANNAAYALARSGGQSLDQFVQAMNAHVKDLGLRHTRYVDPSGIELGNVSTPLEMAQIANVAFQHASIRRYVTTPTRYIRVRNTGSVKKMTSTNWMLYKPEYDDVYVTGGKTGFLYESGWNVAMTIRPSGAEKNRELLIVVFGAPDRKTLFEDTDKLAKWAWRVYQW